MFKLLSLFALTFSTGGFIYYMCVSEEAPYQTWCVLIIGLLCSVLDKQDQ